jgi:DNA mismatch repair protein MSH4
MDGQPDEIPHYGIELARLADLPLDVLEESGRTAAALTALQAKNEAKSESIKIMRRRKALLRARGYFQE